MLYMIKMELSFKKLILLFLLFLIENSFGEDIYQKLGEQVVLTCDTAPTAWLFDGKRITNATQGKFEIAGNILTIAIVDKKHYGIYSCTKDKKFNLIQGVEPALFEGFQEIPYLKEGTELVLKCVFNGAPKVQTKWSKGGIEFTAIGPSITENKRIDGKVETTLKINEVKKVDAGKYKCTATNKFGTIDHENEVKVYAAPGNFTVSIKPNGITNTSVSIRWTRKEGEFINDVKDRLINVEIKNLVTGTTDKKTYRAVTGRGNLIQIDGLTAGTPYTFSVYETVNGYAGNATNITVTTLEGIPSAPRNVTGTSTKNYIQLEWEKPKEPNGKITGYKVEYMANDRNCKQNSQAKYVNETKIKLTNLFPNIKYQIKISAKTMEYGIESVYSITTLKDKPQTGVSNITRRTLNSTSVRISWNAVPGCLQGAPNLEYQLEFIHIKSKETVSKNFTNDNNFIFTNFQNYQGYKVVITPSNTEGAGRIKEEYPFVTPQTAPTEPLNVRAQPVREETVIVSWDRPLFMNGEPSQYQIVYYKIKTCTSYRCPRETPLFYHQEAVGSSMPVSVTRMKVTLHHKFDHFSLYDIKVREKTIEWGPYSNNITVQTKEGESTKPVNVTTNSVTYNSVSVEWNKPETPNGIINAYIIQTYIGNSLDHNDSTGIDTEDGKLRYTVRNLESEITYNIRIRAFNGEQGAASDPLYFTTSAPPSKFPWIFVLVGCLALILVIVLIISVIILVSRRNKLQRYRGVKTAEEIDMSGLVQTKPVALSELKQYCIEQHADSDHLFQQEFESLRSIPTHGFTFEHSKMPYNQAKNRYSNVLAYDHSRVILSPIENEMGSTYINANFIDGYQQRKKYIATQGPIPETVLDFWRMIWEQKVPIIVMLTKLIEDNRLKCEQYWPPGDGLQYKDIVVKVISVNELTDYIIRIFQVYKVNNPDDKRVVRQYHYTAWPDHGVPSHPTSMLSFIRHVVSYLEDTKPTVSDAKKLDGPVVVHCSAGVGRTGTFIAIEGSLRQMDDEGSVDVFGIVCKMRRQRNFMVQTESQYTFIYDALLDSYVCGNTEIAPADLVAKIRFLHEKDPSTGETNFAGEFKRLESGITAKDNNYYSDASHLENKQKNRFLNILPYDKNRVKLIPIAGSRQSDYINASMIDGFQKRNAFIATQAPLENTVNDFWRMVVEQNVHIIVMLTKLEEKGQEKCYLYWPQASTVSYGNVLVGFINFKQEDNVAIRQLRITNKETQQSWTVTHFMYLGWPEYSSPDSGMEIIQMIGLVQRQQRDIQSNSGPLLIHCSGGVGRTGVFISVFNSVERLKAKDVVDVFQTTRALRLQRTAMVQTIDQYMFCYQALKDYLDSFDLYANPQC